MPLTVELGADAMPPIECMIIGRRAIDRHRIAQHMLGAVRRLADAVAPATGKAGRGADACSTFVPQLSGKRRAEGLGTRLC